MSVLTSSNQDFTAMKVAALSYAQTAANVGIALDGSAPFSVDAWVNLNGLCSSASILSKEGVFNFGVIGDTIVLQIAGYQPVQSDPNVQALDDEDWHYLCATFDGVSVRLYIDGQFNYMQGISGTGASNSNPFLIGDDLQALVDSVRIYNSALGADAVLANMFNHPAPANTVAYFDFSQVPPVDTGKGRLPIQLQKGAIMITSVPAMELWGTAYAQPLDESDINPGGYQVDPYTVQAWVYLTADFNPQQTIFINSDLESDTGMALYLQYDGTAGGFRVVSERGASISANRLTSNSVIHLNTWVNVATTFDGTKLSIYVNGTLDTSGPFGPIPLIRNESNLLIGAALSAGQPFGATALQGYISRVDVWSRALSASEVSQYMFTQPEFDATNIEAVYDFMSSPARNRVDGHTIGLADGAALSAQVSRALPSVASRWKDMPEPYAALDEKTMQSLMKSVDLNELVSEQMPFLMKAMESDSMAFEGADREKIQKVWKEAIDNLGKGPGAMQFSATIHKMGKERILLCHTRRGSYVAYRGSVVDIDDCTMWKISLVFVLVAGAIDAIFAVRCYLNARATNYIIQILRNPKIGTLLALGGGMTAARIFEFMAEMNKNGFLTELFKMMVTIGFWAILRIVARMVLIFFGVGAADIIASLVATVATFVYTYLQRPQSCDPLPTVDLAAIKFNYDPTQAANDALSIRKNFTVPVNVPEWTKGMTAPQDSPAAYSIANVTGKAITIQAKFTISTNSATSVQIKADGGGLLGAIDPVTVNFNLGVSSPQYVTFQVPHHTIATSGIQKQDIQWTWYYKIGTGNWTKITVSNHRIYTVLAVPTMPWKQSSSTSETQLPWVDLLEYACVWASGKTNAVDVATAVTQKVYSGVGLTYDIVQGASKYTQVVGSSWAFLCTDFLNFLGGGTGKGNIVNCTDCATIVSTFANILGCDLTESTMYSTSGAFKCNKIIAIGGTGWGYPFPPGNQFAYHEVAWTSALSYTNNIFDACLEFDSGSNPWDWTSSGITHTPKLPTNVVFTTKGISPTLPIATPFTDLCYRERLSQNNAQGIGRCIPQGPKSYSQSGRRKVV